MLIDMNNGPLADSLDYMKAIEKEIEWEDVRILREENEIKDEQKRWMKN